MLFKNQQLPLIVDIMNKLFSASLCLFFYMLAMKRVLYLPITGLFVEHFPLAMGDGFLCLASTDSCNKWKGSGKKQLGWKHSWPLNSSSLACKSSALVLLELGKWVWTWRRGNYARQRK